jgi:Zn-dependent protease with chaperone function
MSLSPIFPFSTPVIGEYLGSLWERMAGLFHRQDFSIEQSLSQTPGIDPRLVPKAPMNYADLDLGLLVKLSHSGYKRGKEITAASHPELHQIWVSMCQRAGLNRVPQLILAESKSMNAASLTNENAVMVSTALFKKLNLREVTAVLGHELGHESSDHTTPRVLAIGLLGLAGIILGDIFGRHGGFGRYIKEIENPGFLRRFGHWVFGKPSDASLLSTRALYVGAGSFVGTVIGSQLSVHPTELDADRKGAVISGDPQGLISALTKLEGTRTHKTIGQKILRTIGFITSGYPSTENRIAKLQAIANAMPADVTPAIALIEPVDPRTPVAAAVALKEASPSLQVSNVSNTARVNDSEHKPAIVV